MKITVIEPHGFCAGVTAALRKALSISPKASNRAAPVYCLHELVHNELVVSDLKKRGFVFVESVDDVPEGATILFSAHGVSPEVRARAQARGLDIVDATCPFVARVHRAARDFAAKGLPVVVIGNPDHAEVRGIVGEVENATVVNPKCPQPQAPLKPSTPIGVVSQTTMNADEVALAISALRADYEVETMAEVCNATKERQDAVKTFSGDALLVLGSANSSNTKRLCEVARCRTFRAGTMDEVKALDLSGIENLGVTSGASTPETFFHEAVAYLRSASTRAVRRLGAMLVAAALSTASLAAACAEKPNVIFILADDLGYGDTGFTWQARAREAARARILTPNLDRLAREGVTLSSHYCAAPVCAPSRASVLLGRVQGRCSLMNNCFDRAFTERDTLGTVMKGAGYATWAVGKWGIAGGGESGESVSSHPLDKGFDYFYGFLDHMAGHTYYHYEGHIRGAFMGITENRTNATASADGIYSTDLFAAKTKELISTHLAREPEKPFFLYLAVNAIHGSGQSGDNLKDKSPLHVPGRPYPEGGVSWPLEKEPLSVRNTWINPAYTNLPPFAARYATAITRMDDAIGDIVRHLEKNGLADDTLIVFTSDNGPADEYGADPRFFDSNGPFDGLKRDVFEGGMRVPAIAHWPARLKPGTVDSAPSQFHDWMATLADVGKVAKPADCDGVSLLPRWEGKVGEPSLVYTQYEFPWGGGTAAFNEFKSRKGAVRGLQQMVRVGDYVALRTCMRDGGANAKVRLYNVVEDPFEQRDLASEESQQPRLRELTKMLDERLRP